MEQAVIRGPSFPTFAVKPMLAVGPILIHAPWPHPCASRKAYSLIAYTQEEADRGRCTGCGRSRVLCGDDEDPCEGCDCPCVYEGDPRLHPDTVHAELEVQTFPGPRCDG